MIVKRAPVKENPFARADLARDIFSANKAKLSMAPVFLKDGLLSEIRDRQKRRRASLRRWVSWTGSLGFGAFLLVLSVRQSGLSVPLNSPVALEVPVPNVNSQKIVRVDVGMSEGVLAPSTSPGGTLGRQLTVVLPADHKPSVWIPVLAQNSGDHFVKLDFFRQDGVMVASRTLQLRAASTANGVTPNAPARFLKSAPVAKVTSSLQAFALLLRPTLFTTKVVRYDEATARDFRARAQNK